jgi:hypothetical protein
MENKTINALQKIAKENNVVFEVQHHKGYTIAVMSIEPSKQIFASDKGVSFPFLRSNDSRRRIIDAAAPHFKALYASGYFNVG